MYFLVGLRRTKDEPDPITIMVYRLSRRVHFIKSIGTDGAVNVANAFFKDICKHQGLLDANVSDRDKKFRSGIRERVMEKSGSATDNFIETATKNGWRL